MHVRLKLASRLQSDTGGILLYLPMSLFCVLLYALRLCFTPGNGERTAVFSWASFTCTRLSPRSMRGTVFELPHAAPRVREHIAATELTLRCEVIMGDALVGVPEGADAYMLKSVIHGRDDHAASTILRNCRDAMQSHAKLLLIERLLPEQIDPDDLRNRSFFMSDMNMMLSPGGRERTETEYRCLLSNAGLRLNCIIRTPSLSAIIEADPA